MQVPAAATKRGLQRWTICAEGQILSSSQGERGDAVLQQNFKNEVSLDRQTVPWDSREQGATNLHLFEEPTPTFDSWPDYDGNIFPGAELICPFPSSTSLLTPAQSFWRMFWSTQQGDSTRLQEVSHGKRLLMQSAAKDMPSLVSFEQVWMAPSQPLAE